jgi:hypothetical protein
MIFVDTISIVRLCPENFVFKSSFSYNTMEGFMNLVLLLGLRLLMGCQALFLRQPDSPIFATKPQYKPKQRYRKSC